MSRHTLCLFSTAILGDLLRQAEKKLSGKDAHFAVELGKTDHRSVVARRAVRDFRMALEDGSQNVEWGKLVEFYMEHRYDPCESQVILTLHEEGKENIEFVRQWIEKHEVVFEICSVRGLGGPRLPAVEILIFALALESERV